jgi:hypothetical protein
MYARNNGSASRRRELAWARAQYLKGVLTVLVSRDAYGVPKKVTLERGNRKRYKIPQLAVEFNTVEDLMNLALEEDEASRTSRDMYEGGFYDRFGRLPTSTIEALNRAARRAEALLAVAVHVEKHQEGIDEALGYVAP